MSEKQGKAPAKTKLTLHDKVNDFIKWMEDETDYCMWDLKVKQAVQIKLIECMTKEYK